MQKDIQEKYGQLKIVCAVTDSGTHMEAAVREMGLSHLPCFLHTIQLVIKHAILNASTLNAQDFKDDIFER